MSEEDQSKQIAEGFPLDDMAAYELERRERFSALLAEVKDEKRIATLESEVAALRAENEAAKEMREALQALHDDNMDYLTRNKLGGENNHCMKWARSAIAAFDAALKATQPERVSVPREPTPQMMEKGAYMCNSTYASSTDAARAIYRALLAAAQEGK